MRLISATMVRETLFNGKAHRSIVL